MSAPTEYKKRPANFPAYPFPGFIGALGIPAQPSNTGMSFRDYIAVKAMETMLNNDCERPSDFRDCYRIADEMIAARGT
jgi:hypothetical protein